MSLTFERLITMGQIVVHLMLWIVCLFALFGLVFEFMPVPGLETIAIVAFLGCWISTGERLWVLHRELTAIEDEEKTDGDRP